ncbi:MAG TPA: M14 family metallopeptidase [Symbiobacteriaceae bacterium]|nr:M14 family metallopeptidase [Symbiobacteriaceae bacterium]
MVAYDPGRYLRYEELTAFLQACAAEYPALCALEEIGRSAEGRSVWAMTLTNTATGAAPVKPGYLFDANTHAGEVTGGAAALYAIHWLLTNYGSDPVATELLDTRAVYAVPRIAVDGTEMYLTTPYLLRSSPRRYPEPADLPGLYPEDVNGDGLILQMRVVHPDGDWKADALDHRALARRRPEDREGTFYKLYSEGLIAGWDGYGVPVERRPRGMDFNRNYPAFWNPEGKQPGAGPYPLSEPETRALAEFLVGHPNIGAYVAFHTTGGVLLRPPSYGADEKMGAADLDSFKRIGELCTRLTGCPCKSTFQAFNYPGQEALVKGADDWAYEHYGVQAYTFELWNPDLRSGGEGYAQVGFAALLARSDEQNLEKERKLLAWNDAELGGAGFFPWTPFVHPQLGPVEIGGWDWKRSLQNAPEGPLLAEEARRAASFLIEHVMALPRLTCAVRVAPLGAGLYKLSAEIHNVGGLPTNVTEMAVTMKTARPIEVRLDGDVQVVSGKVMQEIGHLEGWAAAGGRTACSEAWVDWVVRATAGARLTVTAATPRAGTAVATIAL